MNQAARPAARTEGTFNAETLRAVLQQRLHLSPGAGVRVAFSGGLDSHVLLHALCDLRASYPFGLFAIHIDHGLQPESAAWAESCRRVCRELDVSCAVERVRIVATPRQSLEALAREARYARLREFVRPGDALMTAHHRDDQAETVLLQLLRGAGLHGLAAMPEVAPFGPGSLVRPLLGFSRVALARYAQDRGLRWIEDHSNRDTRYARNFVRHAVLPLLETRWPQATTALARSARHLAQAMQVVDAVAAGDLARCQPGMAGYVVPASSILLEPLRELEEVRARYALRHWIRSCGFGLPHSGLLNDILHRFVYGVVPATASLCWPGAELRRYRDRIYLTRPLGRLDTARELSWDLTGPLAIPGTHASLVPAADVGRGLSRASLAGPVRVRWRAGGEQCLLPTQAHHKKLKKLYQERGIPPWERAYLPLVYVGDALAAVADLWVCAPFAATGDMPAITLALRHTDGST